MHKLLSLLIPADMADYAEKQDFYKDIYVKGLVIVLLPVCAFFGIYDLFISRYLVASLMLLMLCLMSIYLYEGFGTSRRRKTVARREMVSRCLLVIFGCYMLYAIGYENSMDRAPWFLIVPALIFYSINIKEALIWTFCIAALLVYCLFYLNPGISADGLFHLKARLAVTFGLLCGIALITTAIMQRVIKNLFDAQAELQAANRRLSRKIEAHQQAEKRLQANEDRLARINTCFLNFSIDPKENINRLTALCGELLGATCALYNRLDQGRLCSWGQWHAPPGYNPVDQPEGHICYDVIKSESSKVLVVSRLQETDYVRTDPNVAPYGLQTYMGKAVKFFGTYVGSLCVVFQEELEPGEGDKKILGILSAAIGIEEERHSAERSLEESRQKLITYANQAEQLSLAAASMLTIKDEQKIFDNISRSIVEHSDFSRVIISLFKDEAPYRDIIGNGGLDDKTVDRLRRVELSKNWYNDVFLQGEKVGRASYYIPHTQKHILNQEATIFGDGPAPATENAWHPEDNLFVMMQNQEGEFIGVISVDESKSGLKPTDEIVRPLEIFSSLISQIIILRRTSREQKKLEQQLKHAYKMESIGTLAGGIAHDFNNILGIIVGNAELALSDLPKWRPAYANLAEIKTASMRAAGIVKQLLNFSRRSDQLLKPIGFIAVIEDALDFLRSTIPANIEISRNIVTEEVTVLADPIQINQLLMNICTNAFQEMETTGGSLKISVAPMALDEAVAGNYGDLPGGDYVRLEISDTGPGIDPEIVERIFDPYFTTKPVDKGSGMGLAVVHGIVQNHNGFIAVDSTPGRGTTFTTLFPVVTKSPMVKHEGVGQDIPSGTETLIFVDDEPSLVTMYGQILERMGYTVHCKTDPEKALALFRSRPEGFDLVITDMTMPQMTGAALAEKLKAIRADIPIIICTGHSALIDTETAEYKEFAAYVTKPVAMRDMARTIREVLDNAVRPV